MHVLFSQHFVKTGLFDVSNVEALSFAEHIRLLADYSAKAVPTEDAAKAINYAEKFVKRIADYISSLS